MTYFDTFPIDFDREGWGNFSPASITKDNGAFSLSVVNGRGRVTGTNAQGNERQALLWNGSSTWRSTGIKSLWWGSSPGSTAPRPQMGHVHHYNQVGDVATAVAVWHDTAFGLPGILNIARITFVIGPTGATADTGGATTLSGTVPLLYHNDRSGRVRKLIRSSNVAYAYLDPPFLAAGVAVGDTITIAGAADAAFNVTGAAVTVAGGGSGLVGYASVGANNTENCGTGVLFTPTATYRQNLPYWVRSEVSNDIARVKTWVYGMPEPSWADPSAVTRLQITTNANLTADVKAKTVGRGPSGLWMGHLHDNQYAEVSDLEFYPC